jgi:hypothetical protein
MTDQELLDIAWKVYDEFLRNLNAACKYITNLKDLKLFVDHVQFDRGKTGWYGWVHVNLSHPTKEQCERIVDAYVLEFKDGWNREKMVKELLSLRGCDYGYSTEIDQLLTKEEAEQVVKFIKEMSND